MKHRRSAQSGLHETVKKRIAKTDWKWSCPDAGRSRAAATSDLQITPHWNGGGWKTGLNRPKASYPMKLRVQTHPCGDPGLCMVWQIERREEKEKSSGFYTDKEGGKEWGFNLSFDRGRRRRPPGDSAISRSRNDVLFTLPLARGYPRERTPHVKAG